MYAQLKKQRFSKEEINKAVRMAGHTNLKKLKALVIKSTGDITVIAAESERNSMNVMEEISNFDKDN